MSHDAWHSGHAWHQRWRQIGVVCSINIQNGRIGTDFIPPRNNLNASSTDGLMVSFDRQAGPVFGCALLVVWTEPDNWVRVQCKAGLDNTVSTTSDVVTGSHQLSKFDTVAASFTNYHWWFNKPCSWISKIVGLHIPGRCFVQCHSFPNNDSFSTFILRLPLFWLDLIFCHSPQSHNLENRFFFCLIIFIFFTL